MARHKTGELTGKQEGEIRKGPGRPTVYTEEIAEEVLRRIGMGETLASIFSEENERLPPQATVVSWYIRDTPAGFAERWSRAREHAKEHHRITKEMVLRELGILGFSDWRHYHLDPITQQLTLSAGAPDEAMRAVGGVKFTVRYNKQGDPIHEAEVRLWDKNSALEKLGKHLALFTDMNVDLDFSKLNPSQLARIGAGESILEVLLSPES